MFTKRFFHECVYTLPSVVCYWGVPMFIFVSGKGRYTKSAFWPINGVRI